MKNENPCFSMSLLIKAIRRGIIEYERRNIMRDSRNFTFRPFHRRGGSIMTKRQLYVFIFILFLNAATASAQVMFTDVTVEVRLGDVMENTALLLRNTRYVLRLHCPRIARSNCMAFDPGMLICYNSDTHRMPKC